VTAVGTVENRQMALAYEDRVLILSAPGSYREERDASVAQDAGVSGEWQLRTVVIAGNEYDAPELGMDARFILEEGGTARSTAVASDGSMDEEATGSWSYVNQTVTITLGGESVSGEYRNGKIVLQYTGESVWTLERLGGERQAAEEQTAEEEAPDIMQISDDTWEIKGVVPLEDAAKALEIELPTDLFDTIGGYVFSKYGVVPEDGTEFEIEIEPLHIHVTEIKDHRIVKMTVRRDVIEEEEDEEEEENQLIKLIKSDKSEKSDKSDKSEKSESELKDVKESKKDSKEKVKK